MIIWQAGWGAFDASKKEREFLRELRNETGRSNPQHPLHGKKCRIIGWASGERHGWKDFILHLPAENLYAYVHLTWSREDDPRCPRCELFDSTDDLNGFSRAQTRGE